LTSFACGEFGDEQSIGSAINWMYVRRSRVLSEWGNRHGFVLAWDRPLDDQGG